MIDPLRTGSRLQADYAAAAANVVEMGVTFQRCDDEAWDQALTLQQRLLPVGTGRFSRDHFVLGAYLEGQLIGFSATLATATPDLTVPASHHLHSMGVDAPFRHNGIGRVLVELPQFELERVSGRRPLIWGGCSLRLVKFYRKLGFTVFEVHETVPLPHGPFRNGNEDHPFTFWREG
ncbi:GNAT family N-acetyltransferase [Miniimonas sp. S16]|uniref:GNAT family N-acetyltransferase n=1 Tax=Miniimonas sp. S16 TaxID=2171623 RepID=UPI000D52A573|nr:GNAT family N-acetyltransferase [Miniimonas sp. S16]